MYTGPAIDDAELLARLPDPLRQWLLVTNGYVAYHGGLHVRGACLEPTWHSLRAAWFGEVALHRLFPSVRPEDIPFAQDAFGDQYLVRDGAVVHLCGETGEVTPIARDLETFDREVRADPTQYLGLGPLEDFRASGGTLEPGYLLNVYPPVCSRESEAGVSLRPIPALEQVRWLAMLAEQLRGVPDGTRVTLVVRDRPA